MKILSLFSGIGAFEKALDNLGIQYELAGYSEIDKYAVKSYCAIHGVTEDLNLGDITKINEKSLPKDLDLITYGFPCQDISLAGKQKGMFNADGTQTRSGLFFEALRIIEETQPKVAIAENVKNLTSKKFKLQFDIVLRCLEAAGYNNYWKVLNAKDYGIPQNRERVFIVSIRKDVDNGTFEFPAGFPLELRLKDMLEEQVDEKFYLKSTQLNGINGNICKTVRAGGRGSVDRHSWDIVQVAQLHKGGNNPQSGRVYDAEGISPAMDTCQGGNRMPKVVEPFIVASRGRNPENPSDRTAGAPTEQRLEPNSQGLCNTLTTVQKDNYVAEPVLIGGIGELNFGKQYRQGNRVYDSNAVSMALLSQPVGNAGGNSYLYTTPDYLRIRKLTPKECYRLMGFEDIDHDRAAEVVSNSQLYKQAGNSIVVDVLEHLLPNVLKAVK